MTTFEYALTLPAYLVILYAGENDNFVAGIIDPTLKEACQAIVAMAEELD